MAGGRMEPPERLSVRRLRISKKIVYFRIFDFWWIYAWAKKSGTAMRSQKVKTNANSWNVRSYHFRLPPNFSLEVFIFRFLMNLLQDEKFRRSHQSKGETNESGWKVRSYHFCLPSDFSKAPVFFRRIIQRQNGRRSDGAARTAKCKEIKNK